MPTPLHAHGRWGKGVPSFVFGCVGGMRVHARVRVCECAPLREIVTVVGEAVKLLGGSQLSAVWSALCGLGELLTKVCSVFSLTSCALQFIYHTFFFCSLARVKWPSEATTTRSSATRAACTPNCGTLRTAKSSTAARTHQSQQLSDCPRRRRRGRSCRRRS